MEKLRIDKWLWAARFYKTRSLAGEEIDKGRVRVNDVEAKPAKEVKVGMWWQCALGRRFVPSRFWASAGSAYVHHHCQKHVAEQRMLNPKRSAVLEDVRPTKRDRQDWDKPNRLKTAG